MVATDYGIGVSRKPAKVLTAIRVDPGVVATINDLADRFDFTLSDYIRTAIDERLERDMAKLNARAQAAH